MWQCMVLALSYSQSSCLKWLVCGLPGLVGRHLKAHLPTDWATTYLGHYLTLHFSLHAPNIEGCANFDSHGNLMLQSLRTKKVA